MLKRRHLFINQMLQSALYFPNAVRVNIYEDA